MQSQPIFCAANHTVNPSCWPPRGAKLFLFLFFRGVGEDFYERATWDMWKKKNHVLTKKNKNVPLTNKRRPLEFIKNPFQLLKKTVESSKRPFLRAKTKTWKNTLVLIKERFKKKL